MTRKNPMARYGTRIPKIYCIPGMDEPIHENTTKTKTANSGMMYFIGHSLASNEHDYIIKNCSSTTRYNLMPPEPAVA
jgi:hypothetical protein